MQGEGGPSHGHSPAWPEHARPLAAKLWRMAGLPAKWVLAAAWSLDNMTLFFTLSFTTNTSYNNREHTRANRQNTRQHQPIKYKAVAQ